MSFHANFMSVNPCIWLFSHLEDPFLSKYKKVNNNNFPGPTAFWLPGFEDAESAKVSTLLISGQFDPKYGV